MARFHQIGFEQNTTSSSAELSGALAASGTLSSSVVHGGNYSLNVTSLTSAQSKGHFIQYKSAEAADHFFFRVYIRYTGSLPSSENRILGWNDNSAPTTLSIYVTIDVNGALRLYDEDGQIGSASSNLSADTWYRFELEYDTTTSNNNHVITARIDGTNFASASNRFIASTNQPFYFIFGMNLNSEAQTTGSMFFDDIAINDTTGSYQTSWPGPGFIVHIKPNATGDNGDWTNDYTNIDEESPDAGASHINSNTLNQIEDVNCEATPSHLNTNAVINVVCAGVHFGGAGASNNASFQVRLKDDTGGTVTSSASLTPPNTAYRNNALSPLLNYSLVTYTRPGGSDIWTKAYLDTAQVGVILSATSTNAVRVSTLWISIDYVPGIVDSQPAYTKGKDTNTDNQPAYTKGKDTATDSQPAYLNGASAGTPITDNQPAYLVGKATATDNQPAYTKGKDTATDSQPAYLVGKDISTDNQPAYLKGKDTAIDNQPAYLVGKDTNTDNQPAYLVGKDTNTDNQPAYLVGKDISTDSQPAYTKGKDTVTDNQPAYLVGFQAGIYADSQPAYLKGKDTAIDNQPAYLVGMATVIDNQPAYLVGKVSIVNNQPAYLVGEAIALASQPAYLVGVVAGTQITANQPAYLEGYAVVTDALNKAIRKGMDKGMQT